MVGTKKTAVVPTVPLMLMLSISLVKVDLFPNWKVVQGYWFACWLGNIWVLLEMVV